VYYTPPARISGRIEIFMRLRSNFPKKHSCLKFLPSMNPLAERPPHRNARSCRRGMRYRGLVREADMPTPKLTAEIITAAIDGYQFQKSQIDAKVAELRALLAGGPAQTAATPVPTKRKRRKMSAAARARIAEAQRKRWAASRGESEAATPEPAKPKRKLTAAAKAKLVANLKKARAAKAAKAKAAAKKAAPARKKAAVKKAAVKTAQAKAAKRAPVTKAAAKKTAPAAGQAAETAQ
jgi:hypothetical protein